MASIIKVFYNVTPINLRQISGNNIFKYIPVFKHISSQWLSFERNSKNLVFFYVW